MGSSYDGLAQINLTNARPSTWLDFTHLAMSRTTPLSAFCSLFFFTQVIGPPCKLNESKAAWLLSTGVPVPNEVKVFEALGLAMAMAKDGGFSFRHHI